MLIVPKANSQGVKIPYLGVYNTGNTNARVHSGENYLRIYRGVDTGSIKSYRTLEITDHDYDIIYSYFTYGDYVIIAGRVNGPFSAVITLTECEPDFVNSELSCFPTHKTTTVAEGLVGVTHSNQYYEIDTKNRKISVAKLVGEF